MRENRSRSARVIDMPVARMLLALAIVILAACGGVRRTGGSRDPAVITHAELSQSSGGNAYEIVAQLRPSFLRARGRTSIMLENRDLPILYVDDVFIGSIERLREFAPSQIDEIRFMTPSEAQIKWGSGHPGGVILLRTMHR